jgi:hypothetical protein
MIWPEPEAKKLPPEGAYSFRLNREPELRAFTYTDKQGTEREGRKLVLYAVALGPAGEYRVVDAFLPWEPRYVDLCTALGVEHGRDISVSGAVFDADIIHQPDKRDPTKVYARIVNIRSREDAPSSNLPDEDIPF